MCIHPRHSLLSTSEAPPPARQEEIGGADDGPTQVASIGLATPAPVEPAHVLYQKKDADQGLGWFWVLGVWGSGLCELVEYGK